MTPSNLGRAAAAIGAVALTAAGLAACSTSSAPEADPTASSPAASSAPASSAPAGTASSAAPSASTQVSGPDVCGMVTAATIASITADVVRDTVRGQAGSSAVCTYTLSDSVIEVEVTAGSRAAAAYSAFSAEVTSGADPSGSAISVPGLGRQAVSSSLGVAAATAQSAILVLNQRGTVPSQLSKDITIARAVISAEG